MAARRDEQIAARIAAEAQTRDEGRGNVKALAQRSVGSEVPDAAIDERQPNIAVLVQCQPIRRAVRRDVDHASRGTVQILNDEPPGSRVREVDGRSIDRACDAVGMKNVVHQRDAFRFALDAPHLAGHDLRLRVEHGEAKCARIDTSARISAQVIPACDAVYMQHGARLALANMDHVATRADQASVRVERDAADSASLRDDGRHGSVCREAVDAAGASASP